jgi:hypothetical protein
VKYICAAAVLTATAIAWGGQQMKQVAIWDPVFNMPAYTMLIPADWEFEGAMVPGRGCGDPPSGSVVYRANSPDGLTGVQRLPAANRFWSNERQTIQARGLANCRIETPVAAASYVRTIAAHMRPAAQLGQMGTPPAAPKFMQFVRQTDQLFQNNAARQGNPNPWRCGGDTQRVRVRYDYRGRPIEEWVSVEETVIEQPSTGAMGTYPNGVLRLGVSKVTEWTTTTTASRAPAGRLDQVEGQLQAIHDSLKELPEYHRRYTEFMQQQTAQMLANIQRIGASVLLQGERAQAARQANHRAFMQQFEQRAASRRQGFQAKMHAREGRSRDYVDMILDQQLFYDPRTGTSTTQSNQYNHTFGDGNGGVVQTNSATFDPNAAMSGNWTELKPIHH